MEVFKEILDTHTKICTCRKIYKINDDLEITVDQKENKVVMWGFNHKSDRFLNLSTKRFQKLMDGFKSVASDLYSSGNYYYITVDTSKKESIDDKGHGFELGADDYLTKPFYLEELKMRIQALLKRSGKFDQNTLSFGDVRVNLATNSTFVGDKEVELLGKEFDLLVYFLQNQNVILPKSQIFDRLWGFDSDTTVSVVEVYVSKIRKKLKGTDFAANLQTLRSVGYILKNAD